MFISNGIAFGTHEEIEALSKQCYTFAEQTGISMEYAIGAILHIVEIEGRELADVFPQEEAQAIPLVCRCRVCGKHYTHKGEAKACEREHKHPWRR